MASVMLSFLVKILPSFLNTFVYPLPIMFIDYAEISPKLLKNYVFIYMFFVIIFPLLKDLYVLASLKPILMLGDIIFPLFSRI
jgi:hypothetical protein